MVDDVQQARKAIREAMEYAVPPDCGDAAEDVLDIYRDDRLGLSLLLEFYSYLPEARELWVREIRIVRRQRGIFLLAAMIEEKEGYLYLISSEGVEFQGSLGDGYLDSELLDFFGIESAEAFQAICARPESFSLYEPLQIDQDTCPACHAYSGELHELGCPVEICPWCGGQLVNCDCRYEKLGVDSISTEEELGRFEAILEERGRVPYSREQRPSFADEGPGVMVE